MFRTLAVLGLVAAASGAAAQDAWMARAPGQYASRIESGGALQSGSTDLVASGGALRGTYWFTQNGERYDGAIESCRVVRTRAVLCRWRDAFGEGSLEMTFDSRAMSFEGRWNADDTPQTWLSWSGRKHSSS